MYGGTTGPNDTYAMKAARNELKGLQVFSAARIPGLYLPNMVIVSIWIECYNYYRSITKAIVLLLCRFCL